MRGETPSSFAASARRQRLSSSAGVVVGVLAPLAQRRHRDTDPVDKVYLPRVDEPAEAGPAGAAPAEAPRGHETILLVEDTETLRDVIREILEERGYTVLLASNGEEALALARARGGPMELLLTDVVMPKLGGGDLAKLLLALRPEIRVAYMSGYTNGAISEHGVLGEGVMLLEKPFTADKLARAVREALDRPIPRG